MRHCCLRLHLSLIFTLLPYASQSVSFFLGSLQIRRSFLPYIALKISIVYPLGQVNSISSFSHTSSLRISSVLTVRKYPARTRRPIMYISFYCKNSEL
uniref:Putative secreted protein n=1 Tax=Panstrongylus lignarius TaxID=156445 RepID=A0A224XR05_9HEMI